MARRVVIQPPIDFISVDEAARILKIGRSTLYRQMAAKRVPYHLKPTGVRYFTPEDIEQIVADGARPAAA